MFNCWLLVRIRKESESILHNHGGKEYQCLHIWRIGVEMVNISTPGIPKKQNMTSYVCNWRREIPLGHKLQVIGGFEGDPWWRFPLGHKLQVIL
jgi:hypothetical protein